MKNTNIKNMYAIYDEKAESYNAPFPLATDGLAKRSFEDACKDSRTDLYKYPGDFTLYCVATWDDNLGRFENIIPARFVAKNIRPTEKFEEAEKWYSETGAEIEKIEKEIEKIKVDGE